MHRSPDPSLARWAQRVEAFLLRLLVLVLLALLIGQNLLRDESLRSWMSYVDRLEGEEYRPAIEDDVPEAVEALYVLPDRNDVYTVSIVLWNQPSASDAQLIIDGIPVADFSEPHMTIEVQPGDHIEIDGRSVSGELIFRIVDVSPALSAPAEGDEIRLHGEIHSLGIVQLR